MADVFEVWAPREVQRLRQEADVLQLALDRFLASRQSSPSAKSQEADPNGNGQSRKPKHDALFNRWAEASASAPIGYDDMERIAAEQGVAMNRSLLRSTVHAQKQTGRVRVEGDGYVWQKGES